MPLPSFLNSQILFMLQKTMSKPMSIKRDRKCKIAIISIYEKSVFFCVINTLGYVLYRALGSGGDLIMLAV